MSPPRPLSYPVSLEEGRLLPTGVLIFWILSSLPSLLNRFLVLHLRALKRDVPPIQPPQITLIVNCPNDLSMPFPPGTGPERFCPLFSLCGGLESYILAPFQPE